MRQPQNSGLMKERLPNLVKEFFPELQRPECGSGVNLVGSIAHPNDARFATGTRTTMAGTVSVDENDPLPRSLKLISRPGAKHSGADNCHVICAVVHCSMLLARRDDYSNAFEVCRFAVDRHIESRSLSGFINFDCSYPIDYPEHAVSKNERPQRREPDRAELDEEEM